MNRKQDGDQKHKPGKEDNKGKKERIKSKDRRERKLAAAAAAAAAVKWKRIRNDDEKFRFQSATNKPKKENKVQGESVEHPFPHSFGCKRETQRERERRDGGWDRRLRG